MTEHHHTASTPRERELEIEVARLQAELETLRGEDPAGATSRFLAMAAATVDQAVEDARREADEIVEEVSSQAEARRDEATRVAAEAEAMAEQMLADADRAQERIDAANEEAEAIKAAAEEEAEQLISTERQKVAGEIEALAEVRNALQEERSSLETYHEELRRRVQELAESMVSFMTSELPAGAATAIENLAVPELDAVLGENPSLTAGEAEDAADDADDVDDTEADEADEADEVEIVAETEDDEATDDIEVEDVEAAGEFEDDGADLFVGLMDDEDDAVETVDQDDAVAAEANIVETEGVELSADPFDAIPTTEVAEESDDPWTSALESAIPADEAYPDAVTVADDAIDEIPPGPPASFDDREIVEDPMTAADTKPSSSGLFSRASVDETGFEDLADDDTEETPSTGLFGMLGSRLVSQTATDELADALDADDDADDAFNDFLAGDEEPDPSRDWLLRPEQG